MFISAFYDYGLLIDLHTGLRNIAVDNERSGYQACWVYNKARSRKDNNSNCKSKQLQFLELNQALIKRDIEINRLEVHVQQRVDKDKHWILNQHFET